MRPRVAILRENEDSRNHQYSARTITRETKGLPFLPTKFGEQSIALVGRFDFGFNGDDLASRAPDILIIFV